MFGRMIRGAQRAANKSWFAPSVAGGLYTAGAAAGYAVSASEDCIPPPHNHWPYDGWTQIHDTASLRRGYEVYRQVCSTCHSLKLINFRNLVGVTHTEEQARALASQYETMDGPNDDGEMFERTCKLSDAIPGPYANDQAARAANGGALPPDLSCIAKARHSGPDYIYALLTGYDKELPAGWPDKPGLHYNPYFPDGAIAMAAPLSDGQVEYEDDTPATVSQMAKDVVCFLQWCSEPEQDDRKKKGCQMIIVMTTLGLIAGYYKRWSWASVKSRRISWID